MGDFRTMQNGNQNNRLEECIREDHADHMPLTMAYVPWQQFAETYEPAKALKVGTIFPELDKPFYGRRARR